MPRILVVDDEPDVLFLMKTILGRAGHEVAMATNGAQGLEAAKQALPDLVITDLMMPVMDGRQMIARMKDDDDLANIPVIVVSAVPEEGLGADAVLRKPFGSDELLAAVERAIVPSPS